MTLNESFYGYHSGPTKIKKFDMSKVGSHISAAHGWGAYFGTVATENMLFLGDGGYQNKYLIKLDFDKNFLTEDYPLSYSDINLSFDEFIEIGMPHHPLSKYCYPNFNHRCRLYKSIKESLNNFFNRKDSQIKYLKFKTLYEEIVYLNNTLKEYKSEYDKFAEIDDIINLYDEMKEYLKDVSFANEPSFACKKVIDYIKSDDRKNKISTQIGKHDDFHEIKRDEAIEIEDFLNEFGIENIKIIVDKHKFFNVVVNAIKDVIEDLTRILKTWKEKKNIFSASSFQSEEDVKLFNKYFPHIRGVKWVTSGDIKTDDDVRFDNPMKNHPESSLVQNYFHKKRLIEPKELSNNVATKESRGVFGTTYVILWFPDEDAEWIGARRGKEARNGKKAFSRDFDELNGSVIDFGKLDITPDEEMDEI